jgi:hypothetical protein
LTTGPESNPNNVIHCRELANRFNDAPGAQVLLLDVEGVRPEQAGDWPSPAKNVGLMRVIRASKGSVHSALLGYLRENLPLVERFGELQDRIAAAVHQRTPDQNVGWNKPKTLQNLLIGQKN